MANHILRTNFSEHEITCPCGCGKRSNDEAIIQLQALRHLVNEPLVITSSARCSNHNKLVGGKSESQHLGGTAFDISCTTGKLRQKIFCFAPALGFNGIGVGDNFIHVDLRSENDSVCWTYYKSKM